MSDVLERIDRLKRELDSLRPLPPEAVARVGQKLRIESNYHSNAVEGNSLTLGETRSLILHGLTAHGKPIRDHLDIKGHDEAVKAVEEAVVGEHGLTEVFIRGLHAILLKEPYEVDAETPEGRPARRQIEIGAYKSAPNNVRTSTGETYYFTSPEQVKPAMSDLMDWYEAREAAGEHPIVLAATFHYRFVRIHPFDDGNGRMARLLMNMILIRHGYTVAIIQKGERDQYIEELERADKSEDLAQFIDYIASCCDYALNLHVRAARGESIEEADDIDREIALFKQSFVKSESACEQIAAREYVENVVIPFRGYCLEKLNLFRDEFVSISEDIWSIDGRSIDNKTFSISTYDYESGLKAPETAFEIATRFLFGLYNFQSTKKIVSISIDSKLNSDGCNWTFSLDHRDIESYNGQDLTDLQTRFNSLLRNMMNDLGGLRLRL